LVWADHDVLDRLILAEQDERRRLALFLHDGPVQQLSGIALMLDGALHAISGGENDQAQGIIETALLRHRATIRELRDLSFALEPVVLRDQGLELALRALADQTEASHGIPVAVELAEAGVIGETASIALYTILRELVDQAVRRGPPTEIAVSVALSGDGSLIASVADDAEPERRRRSIEAIQERTRQLHGTAELLVEGKRSEVRVTLPAHTAQR
jgi:signal transduction histidine kinase